MAGCARRDDDRRGQHRESRDEHDDRTPQREIGEGSHGLGTLLCRSGPAGSAPAPRRTLNPYAFCVALAADQQAMLQLLLERGQSYEDLAAVLGVDEAGVRGRARAALTELAGVDPDRNVGLTDYLLGQADPIGRADAVRHLKDDPADLELATELSQKLRLVAPQAELPRLPGEERRPRPRPRRRRRAPPDSRSAARRSEGERASRAALLPRPPRDSPR